MFIMFWFLWLAFMWNQTFSFNLQKELSSVMQKYSNITSDDYLWAAYSDKYSEDPFWDILKSHQDMIMHQKINWVDNVWAVLSDNGCTLSNDKIYAILYYFSPDFRADVSYEIKKNSDWDDIKLQFDRETIERYCSEYYACNAVKKDLKFDITSNTPKDVMTNCKEFFLTNYEEGVSLDEMSQNLQTSQLWADKFFNAVSEDSPYDIMSDLDTVSMLMFEDVEPPVQTVFYHLPIFAKAEKNIQEWWSSRPSNEEDKTGNDESDNETSGSPISSSIGWPSWSSWSPLKQNKPIVNNDEEEFAWNKDIFQQIDDETQKFLSDDELNLWSMDDSLFYGKTCSNNAEEIDSETYVLSNDGEKWLEQWWESDLMEFSEKEYEEFVGKMMNNIDKYAAMDEETRQEIENNKSSWWTFTPAGNADDIQKQAEEIKNCYEKCDGLRIDQKASCYVMCSCGEWDSPVFDPEQFPWLGPILYLRWCAVPAKSQTFSVWWTKLFSIEKWINEIYWVTLKLSDEWKLGIWTEQHNFLDSSTKKMNFGKMITFTLNVDFVDLGSKLFKSSVQFLKRKIQEKNENKKQIYWISNPLNNPVSKNKFRIVWEEWENTSDYSASVDYEWLVDKKEDMNTTIQPMVNRDTSYAERYVMISEMVDKWAKQQQQFWEQATEYANNWGSLSEMLYSKKW